MSKLKDKETFLETKSDIELVEIIRSCGSQEGRKIGSLEGVSDGWVQATLFLSELFKEGKVSTKIYLTLLMNPTKLQKR